MLKDELNSIFMHVITRARLIQFGEKHPDSKGSLLVWNKIISGIDFADFVELREAFPSADQVGNFTVFNIGGNKFRLITLIDYNYQKVFIRHVLTHAEYDKDRWKKDEWY
jgi:mRNA interferase HigB